MSVLFNRLRELAGADTLAVVVAMDIRRIDAKDVRNESVKDLARALLNLSSIVHTSVLVLGDDDTSCRRLRADHQWRSSAHEEIGSARSASLASWGTLFESGCGIHLVGGELRRLPAAGSSAELLRDGGPVTAEAVTLLVSNSRDHDDLFRDLQPSDVGVSVGRIVPGADFRVDRLDAAASILDLASSVRYIAKGCRRASTPA